MSTPYFGTKPWKCPILNVVPTKLKIHLYLSSVCSNMFRRHLFKVLKSALVGYKWKASLLKRVFTIVCSNTIKMFSIFLVANGAVFVLEMESIRKNTTRKIMVVTAKVKQIPNTWPENIYPAYKMWRHSDLLSGTFFKNFIVIFKRNSQRKHRLSIA